MPDPDRRRVQLPFGQGLQRETGVMAVRQGSMEDLRNVYLRRAKVQLRRGNEERLALTDENGVAITHILAGQEVRGERIGLLVGYQGDATAAAHGAVYIYRIDAGANVSTRLGKWFDQTDPANNDPPTVITAENFGKVLFAHDKFRQEDRATTLVYSSTDGRVLEDLTGDLTGEGSEDDAIKFRGVVSYLDYMVGWGFGDVTEARSELLRISRPGAPTLFERNDYFVVGSRSDPVITAKPAGDRLIVMKEAETYALTGTSPANFGLFPVDERFGCLAPRLALSVQGTVFFWSAEGPRATTGGISQQISIPLELEAPEPSDLVARTDFEKGFASYIPEEQIAIWVFGKRVYSFNLRGEQRGWAYWELGFEPESGFSLYNANRGAADAVAPTGAPEWTENDQDRTAGEALAVWDNVGQDGDEFVEIWGRPSKNLFGAAWRLGADGDGDGVVDGWTKASSVTATFSFVADKDGTGHGAQKIEVTSSASSGAAEVYRSFTDSVEAGKDYTIGVELLCESLAGAVGRIKGRWLDGGGTELSTFSSADFTFTNEFERRILYDQTAPTNAAELEIRLQVVCSAGGDTGTVFYRLAGAYKVEDQSFWRRLDSTSVSTTTEQTESITDLPSGQFYQTAVRYRAGALVTSGYEGQDADTWPDKSKGVAVAGTGASGTDLQWHTFESGTGLTLDGLVWVRTSNSTEGVRREWTLSEQVYQDMKDSAEEGGDPGIIAYRRLTGNADWNELYKIQITTATELTQLDNGRRLIKDFDDTPQGETEYDYTAAIFFDNEESGKLAKRSIWIGPQVPIDFFAYRDQDGTLVAEWTDQFYGFPLSGPGAPGYENTTVIETKNITQGESSFSFAGEVDQGTEIFKDELPADSDEVDVRIRHETEYHGTDDNSPWTSVDTVASGEGGSSPTDPESVAGMSWGLGTGYRGQTLNAPLWIPDETSSEKVLISMAFTDDLHDRFQQAADNGQAAGFQIYRQSPSDSTWQAATKVDVTGGLPMDRNENGNYQFQFSEIQVGEDEMWQFTAAPFIGGTEGDKLAGRDQWLGPPHPENGSLFQGSTSGEIEIEWFNKFEDIIEDPPGEKHDWRTEVQTKDITAGETTFTEASGSPVTFSKWDEKDSLIETATSGNEVEVRIAHRTRFLNNEDRSEWINLGTVVAP